MQLVMCFLIIWASICAVSAMPTHLVLTPPAWVFKGATVDLDFANQRYWVSAGGSNTTDGQEISATRTTTATCQATGGSIMTVAASSPCITDQGLFIWGAVTNLILQSAFASGWTDGGATLVSSGGVAAPDGSTALKLQEDASAATTHAESQSVAKAASALKYSFSVYARLTSPTGRTRIALQVDDAAGTPNGAVMVCDLSGQQIGVNTAGVGTPFTTLSQTAVGFPNGWTRCTIIATSNTATTIRGRVFLDSGSGTGAISTTYDGNGASGVVIWGAQLEQDLYFDAGPYVATTTGSATRNLDQISLNPTSATQAGTLARSPKLGSEYSLYCHVNFMSPVTYATNQYACSLNDASTNNRLTLFRSAGTNNLGTRVTTATTSTNPGGGTITSGIVPGTPLKIAIGVVPGTGGAGGASAGTAWSTANPAALPVGPYRLSFGVDETIGNSPLNGWIRRVAVFGNRRLSDAEFASLTTGTQ